MNSAQTFAIGRVVLPRLGALAAVAEQGNVKGRLPADGGDAEALLAEFARAGVADAPLAAELQREATRSFDQSWNELMDCIASKSTMLKKIADRLL